MVDADATWCARCGAVLHRNCLQRADTICPSCRRVYDSPERHFVYSRFCPECMQLNDPPKTCCVACGAGTQWDTPTDYERFVKHMTQTARSRLLRGFAELGAGAMCLLALIAALAFTQPSFVALSMFLLGFMLLTVDGVGSIIRSKKIRKFIVSAPVKPISDSSGSPAAPPNSS